MTTRDGIPLGAILTAANMHEVNEILPLVFLEFPHVGGVRGRPLDRPLSVTADKAYDSRAVRKLLAMTGIAANIPRRGEREDTPLGYERWAIERTISWLKQFRRLRIRWDRDPENYMMYYSIAASIITWRFLKK